MFKQSMSFLGHIIIVLKKSIMILKKSSALILPKDVLLASTLLLASALLSASSLFSQHPLWKIAKKGTSQKRLYRGNENKQSRD
jgi:hypothetical protein